MAYAAVACLKTTITRLQKSSRISVASSTQKFLKFAHKELCSLQEVLQRSDGSRSNDLDQQIIKAVHNLEDSLETHEFNAQSQNCGDSELKNVIASSMETVKKIKQQYKRELNNSLPEEEDDDEEEEEDNLQLEKEEEKEEDGDGNDYIATDLDFYVIKQQILGFNGYVFTIVGMAGIGKTALAKVILKDPDILSAFEHRAFYSIGQVYQSEKMKQAILAQVNPNKKKLPVEKDEKSLDGYLKKYLHDKRYLIVLDDVWNLDFWYDFFKDRRRDETMGSCLLLTTRLQGLPLESIRGNYYYSLVPFLDKVQSWDLLCKKVFAATVCPSELKSVGKRIAENCDGLPLLIVTVADILKKADKTREYWKEAAHRKSVVFQNAYDQILQVFYPSYYNLSAHARSCFLYMAAFPPNRDVRRSKLVNLWCAEGFLDPNNIRIPVKYIASNCFDKLNHDNVVVPEDSNINNKYYQSCSLHSIFRHLCGEEFKKNHFLHIIQSIEVGSAQTEPSKRRVCIHHNVLLSNGDVRSAIESSPSVRSLLCTGAYHKYEVRLPEKFEHKLLRVCDVLTIRFLEFPSKLLEHVQLRYLAITCNDLPPCINKLWKLEYLIVHQHLSIMSSVEASYVPVQVWELQELVHLQLIGRNLPNPPRGVELKRLAKLLDVGAYTCTDAVLTSMPNLMKLRVQIYQTSDEPALSSLHDNISKLTGLLSLQYVSVNHTVKSEIFATPSFSIHPSSVTKLTLSGLGYPWEYLNTILKVLPSLQGLKLLWYAFSGKKWEVEEMAFSSSLKWLSIEDNDLEQWKARNGNFPYLTHLTLKYCYKLKEIPELSSLQYMTQLDTRSLKVNEECIVTSSTSWAAAPYTRELTDYIYKIYTMKGEKLK